MAIRESVNNSLPSGTYANQQSDHSAPARYSGTCRKCIAQSGHPRDSCRSPCHAGCQTKSLPRTKAINRASAAMQRQRFMARSKGGRGKSKKQSKSAVNSMLTGIEADAANHDGRARPVHSWRTRQRIALFAIIAAVPMAGLAWAFGSNSGLLDQLTRSSAGPALTFVGSEACADCHQAETALWQESQHKHAMPHANRA